LARALQGIGVDVSVFWHEWGQEFQGHELFSLKFPDLKIVNLPWRSWKLGKIHDADVVLVSYHINPRIGFMLTRLRKKVPTFWLSGEPNRALWERWITGVAGAEHYRTEVFRSMMNGLYGNSVGRVLSTRPMWDLVWGAASLLDYEYVQGFDRIFSQSSLQRGLLQRIYGRDSVVVNPCSDPAVANGYRISYGDFFLCGAALERSKNLERIVSAFRFAREKTDSNCRLVLAPPQYRARSAVSIQEGEGVEVHPMSRREYLQAYAGCCAAVAVSLWEPFGLTFGEAALFKKPTIMSTTSGCYELVDEGVTGFGVNPYDAKDLATVFMLLMSDSKIAEDVGEAAYGKVCSQFTIRHMAERIQGLIETYL